MRGAVDAPTAATALARCVQSVAFKRFQMLSNIRCSAFVTLSLAITMSACSAGLAAPAAPVGAAVACRGGTLRSAADAEPYSTCDNVTGDLHIAQSTLTSLDALRRLRSVSGTLEIAGNAKLVDVRGLGQLVHVGALDVHGNQDLDSLSGLEKLRSAASVRIADNAELENLEGLEGLDYVDDLRIENNGIHDTVGLGKLRAVGTLAIQGNSKLISLRGFKGLTRAKLVQIRNNPLVAAYYGLLPQLQRVEQLVISHNSGLSKSEVRAMLARVEHDAEQPIIATQSANLADSPRQSMRVVSY